MKTIFVILSYPRTGSTYLCKALNSCNNLTCHSEIFHPDFDAFSRSFLDDSVFHKKQFPGFEAKMRPIDSLFKMRKKDPMKFLRTISKRSKSMGFKIFQFQNDKILHVLLKDQAVKKIVLERRNRLESYVSTQIALKTGKWDRYKGENPKLNPIMVDPDDFLEYKRRIDKSIAEWEFSLDSTSQMYFKVYYEEIIRSFPLKGFEDFLQVSLSDIQLQIDQVKQNPFSLNDLIINYEEIIGLNDHVL